MSFLGTTVFGIKMPIIEKNDPLAEIIIENLEKAFKKHKITVQDRDIIGITEAVVAKAQNNYASIIQIAKDIKNKFNGGKIGIVFPILSRNRFSLLLKAISLGADELVVLLSYPFDEVGNPLIKSSLIAEQKINPYTDSFSEAEFNALFPDKKHPITNIDYVSYYQKMVDCPTKFVFSNDPTYILNYCDKVLVASIHNRDEVKNKLRQKGASLVYGLDDLLTSSVDGSGYNQKYGLLGSNLASANSVKLFPRDSQEFVTNLQKKLFEKYNKQVEVLVYGDGAYKDPLTKIWELADPVVSPGYTKGLEGFPQEVKLKYIIDNSLQDLKGHSLESTVIKMIKSKNLQQTGSHLSLGTTPRKIVSLVGSLCDLTSGSGDKGTPVVYIKGYFDNYSSK